MEAELRPLVESFPERSAENARKMRDLVDSDPNAFPLAAVRIFRDSNTHRGCKYLVTVLWTQNLLTPLLLDPSIPLELCIWMAQTAGRVDPRFHVELSSSLQHGMLEREDVPTGMVTRVFEILSATMETSALAPLLRKILLHPDARIRSKAMLLIGRGPTGIGAVERLLPDEDPRVRANALESLWSNPDPRTVAIFEKAVRDSNNRVIGNAIMGLYLAGSTKSIAAAFDLASHPSAIFRGTGAWIMGATGDPRFLPILGRLVGESSGQLRKIVFQALQAIRKSASGRAECTLTLKIFSKCVNSSRLLLRICVTETATNQKANLRATAFVISAEAEPVVDYSCEANAGKHLAIGLVVPLADGNAPLHRAAETAVERFSVKRPGQEQCGVFRYSSGSPAQRTFLPFKFMGVSAEPEVQETTASSVPEDLAGSLLKAIRNPLPIRGTRHIVALHDGSSSPDEDAERTLISEGRSANISLHVLSTRADLPMQRISQQLCGSFHVVSSLETIQVDLDTLYEALTSYYEIDVPASIIEKDVHSITVQVFAANGWGKCEVPVPL